MIDFLLEENSIIEKLQEMIKNITHIIVKMNVCRFK